MVPGQAGVFCKRSAKLCVPAGGWCGQNPMAIRPAILYTDRPAAWRQLGGSGKHGAVAGGYANRLGTDLPISANHQLSVKLSYNLYYVK